MKITATQKFLNAMKLAQEQKEKHNEQMTRLVCELYQAIPEEARTEKVQNALEALYKEFNKYEQHPYDSFRNCIFRILQWELNSKLLPRGFVCEYHDDTSFTSHPLWGLPCDAETVDFYEP